jgi:DNA-binding NarL/FixJ family response regulator
MPHSSVIRLVLVEPQRLIREALRAVLQSKADIMVVGEAGDAPEVLGVVDSHQPDVVLIAFDGSTERDLAVLAELPRVAERARTVLLTSEVDAALHAHMIELGVMGLVPKAQSAQVLVKAVKKVHAGELWLDRSRTADVVNHFTRKRADDDPESTKIASLTVREEEIVALVTEGMDNKDIAERLFISECTVRNHLTSILDKLQLSNRFQLAVYAFRRGLVFCPQMPAIMRRSRTVRMESSARERVLSSEF